MGRGRRRERVRGEDRRREKGKRTRRCWPSGRRDLGPERLRAPPRKVPGLGSGLGHMWTRDESAGALAPEQSGPEQMGGREQVGRPNVGEAFS